MDLSSDGLAKLIYLNREDPNLASNRILFPEEIRVLQNEQAYQRQKLNDIDKKLGDTREIYRKYQEIYKEKRRELESIISLLHMYKSSIKALEDTQAVHQAETVRVSRLLNPAKRCPEDILRKIFEFSVYLPYRPDLAEATRISHVCQHWRTIAVTTSCLWSQLHATTKDKPSMIRFMFNTMSQRLKSRPVNIDLTIDALNTTNDIHSLDDMAHACEIEQFKAIERLSLQVGRSKDILQVCKKFNMVEVKHLEVSHDYPKNNNHNDTAHLDYECLLRKFLPAHLTLRSMDAISFGSEPIYQLLSLKIGSGTASIQHLGLNTLVNLEDLVIFDHQGIWDDDITLPMLRKLHIARVDDSFWRMLVTPQVTSVRLREELSEGALGYLDRHPSVGHLDLGYTNSLDDASTRRLAAALPALESLTISGPRQTIAAIIGFLANPQQINSEDVAFPLLMRLSLDGFGVGNDGGSFPWNAVERLINDRCFANNRGTGPNPLDLSLNLYFAEVEGAPWNDSSVLKSGIVSEAVHASNNQVYICFRWPI